MAWFWSRLAPLPSAGRLRHLCYAKLFFKKKETRMKTSLSSKAICIITDRQTAKIFTEQMLIYEEISTKKLERYLNQGPRKSRFPLNVVDRRTDICFYRVAVLLKIDYLQLPEKQIYIYICELNKIGQNLKLY